MSHKARLADLLGPDEPKPLAADAFVYEASLPIKRRPKPKRRPFVTQDGTAIARDEARPVIVYGESFRIAGTSIALDALPKPSGQPITFDGAVQPSDKLKGNR